MPSNKAAVISNNNNNMTVDDLQLRKRLLPEDEALHSQDEGYEDDKVDPFSHDVQLTTWQWIRTAALTLLLLPIRLLGVFLIIVVAWACCAGSLLGLTDEEKSAKPLAGCRAALRGLANHFGQLGIYCCGFIPVIKGRMAAPEEAPVMVMAPHSTFFDSFAVFWCGVPYLVSRAENRKIPFLGKCIESAQTLFVSREDPQSRQKTVAEIIRRARSGQWSRLALFPEGSTSNRKALMTFKPGAFYPGQPVQPVILRYPNKLDTITWTWNQKHGALHVIWLTLSQPFTRAEMEFLPVYHPNEAEKADAKLYARNVRAVMAEALGVPTSDTTFEEAKAKFGKKNKKKRAKLE